MKKTVLGILLFGIFGAGLVGCKKDDANKINLKNDNTRSYSSYDDVLTELDKVLSLSEKERRDFESSNGYTSLFTKSYIVYEGLDVENLKNNQEVYDYVDQNSDFIELKKNEDGEMECRPVYSDNYYSLITGENRMFKIDTICYKVFADGLISTHIKNFNMLENVRAQYVVNVSKNSSFKVSMFVNKEFNTKAYCGTYAEATQTNKKNRTKIWVSTYNNTIPDVTYGNVNNVEAFGQIRPYKKTLGIWYFASRTIEGRIKFDVTFTLPSGTVTYNFDETIYPNNSYTQVRRFDRVTWQNVASNLHFSSINCWGDTPDTATAYITCN